jgi:hypothetical protein
MFPTHSRWLNCTEDTLASMCNKVCGRIRKSSYQVEQATEVEVYTGREIVQGQSVIVRVVADSTVYILAPWVIVVAKGQNVVKEATTVVV